MSGRVKLGSIGLGWWGGMLASGVAASGEGVVTACFARDPEARKAFAANHSAEPMDSLDQLLDSDIEAVLIATPHTTHAALAVAAAKAGKHVFIDKPLSLTMDEADQIAEAAAARGIAVQVGHNRRRQPANRELAGLIVAGDLGDLVSVEAVHHAPLLHNPALVPWRRSVVESPAGGMTALGVHQVDTFHYLAGPVSRVSAHSVRGFQEHEVDSFTSIDFIFESGISGHLASSMVTGPVVDVSVYGSQAIARNRNDGASLTLQPRGSFEETSIDLPPLDTIADQLVEFCNVVRGAATPETGLEEGRAAVAVLEAIVSSADSGTWVDVDYRISG
jgi:predicted dehydrogenase